MIRYSYMGCYLMQVLNLFLVLLLSSFSTDALDQKESEDELDKISEAKGRIVRLFAYGKKSICKIVSEWKKRRESQRRSRNPTIQEIGMATVNSTLTGILCDLVM